MPRYNHITDLHKREIVMLKARDCSYGKCVFCDYKSDNNNDISNSVDFNSQVLNNVTGIESVLEVINSGNVFDLPLKTLADIKTICLNNDIHTVYFESYINDIKRFEELRNNFYPIKLRFRLGLETFDDEFRKYLGKPFKYQKLANTLEAEYYSVCLLICVKGQTKEQIIDDITKGLNSYQQITINMFIDNTTIIKQDKQLTIWFLEELAPLLQRHQRIELLIDNKDLGVY